jgi:hypothetical protein
MLSRRPERGGGSPKQERMNMEKLLQKLAIMEAGQIEAEARKLLEMAVKDGDDIPAVRVVITLTISADGDGYLWDAEAKAERKQARKTEKLSGNYDPRQPELFTVEGE